jgi:hypothetical protein
LSASDVPPDEMGWDPNATDDALERMLSGQAQTTDEWRELVGFVEELSEAVPVRPLMTEDLHVAAMVETSQLMADKGDPVARPVSNADAPAPQVSRLPKLRRKPMKRSTRTLVRVLAPIAAVLTVMGSMAYAGALPHTVQKVASHAAGTLGLNVPGDDESTDVPGDDDQGENADDQGDNDSQGEDSSKDEVFTPVDEGDQGESSDESSDTATSDDQGENADDQGDNDSQGEDTQSDSQGEDTQSDDQGADTQSNDQGEDTQSSDTQSPDESGDQGGSNDQQGDSQD